MHGVERLICGLNSVFCFSWVKKNVKETYGGDEEVSDLMLLSHFTFLVVFVNLKFLFFHFLKYILFLLVQTKRN